MKKKEQETNANKNHKRRDESVARQTNRTHLVSVPLTASLTKKTGEGKLVF